MNLSIKSDIQKFLLGFEKAQEVLNNPTFWKAIASHPGFDNTKLSPDEIATLLQQTSHQITLEDWKPTELEAFTKYRKTNAKTVNKELIYLNVRKSARSIQQIAGTIIHEGIHAVDLAHPDKTFGHAGNSRTGNENTAPYWIGDLVINILKGTYEPSKSFKYFLTEED